MYSTLEQPGVPECHIILFIHKMEQCAPKGAPECSLQDIEGYSYIVHHENDT